LTKIPLVYGVSYFNFGGLGASFGGAKPSKAPRGDWTAEFNLFEEKQTFSWMFFLYDFNKAVTFMSRSAQRKAFNWP